MSVIYESITLDLDKITDERIRHIAAATDELMDEKLASIGYVKVVRCRDCKRFSLDDSDHDYRSGWWCHRWNTDMVKPDGFCAWGVRRDA